MCIISTIYGMYLDQLKSDPEAKIEATVQGWVRTARRQKRVCFVSLTDGTTFQDLQLVAKTLPDECVTGASIEAKGVLKYTPKRAQPIELQVEEIKVIGECHDPSTYPMAKKEHTPEHLRSYLHLRPRVKKHFAVMRLRNALAKATHDFFQERGFMWVHTPLITFSDCEGAGEAFHVMDSGELRDRTAPPGGWMKVVKGDKKSPSKFVYEEKNGKFFRRDAFLTVSGQLEVESYACAFSKVYTFGPTFRAEHSQTSRHLAEFWMIEPECPFITFSELQEFAEAYIKYCIKYCLEHHFEEIQYLDDQGLSLLYERLQEIVRVPFKRMSYTEAIEMLSAEFPEVKWGIDLSSDHEKWLVAKALAPVIVTDYPASLKPFYMKVASQGEARTASAEDGKTVECMDVLVPGIGELIGGSMREEKYDVLIERMREKGMDLETYEWYMDLRKYGTVKHGGFGLGFERLVMLVTDVSNIKDVIPFPRSYRGV